MRDPRGSRLAKRDDRGSSHQRSRGVFFVDSFFKARPSRTLSVVRRGSVALSISAVALNVAPAFAAGDTTAPAAVKGMSTSADTSRVKLDWSGNTESDLAGYLVYRSTS